LKSISRRIWLEIRELFPIYLTITLRGWIRVFHGGFKGILALFARLTLSQYIFLGSAIGIFVLSLLPWLTYSVEFVGEDLIAINSNFRVIFIFPSLTGPLLLVLPLRRKIEMYYSTWGIVMLLYIAGFPFPNPIHTLMIDPSEYRFLPWMYVYGASLLLAGLFALTALRRGLFDFGFLFSPLKSSIPETPFESKRAMGKKKR
jgi:hypothetical protein